MLPLGILMAMVIGGCASIPPHHVRYLGNGIYYLGFQSKALPRTFWKQPNETIVPYMKEHHLVPPDCTEGVTIIQAETILMSQSAFARFKCTE